MSTNCAAAGPRHRPRRDRSGQPHQNPVSQHRRGRGRQEGHRREAHQQEDRERHEVGEIPSRIYEEQRRPGPVCADDQDAEHRYELHRAHVGDCVGSTGEVEREQRGTQQEVPDALNVPRVQQAIVDGMKRAAPKAESGGCRPGTAAAHCRIAVRHTIARSPRWGRSNAMPTHRSSLQMRRHSLPACEAFAVSPR